MENNNSRGVFYGVIGVATLVVAVIGATFAYFSAQAASNSDAIKAESGTVDALTFTQQVYNTKTNLIPVASSLTRFPEVIGLDEDTDCLDDNKNEICSVYQFTVQNGATSNQTLYFAIDPVEGGNTFSHLHYAVVRGNPTTFPVTGTVASVPTGNRASGIKKDAYDIEEGLLVQTGAFGANDDSIVQLDNLTQVLEPNATTQYTIILWIEEEGAANSDDVDKAFSAALKVSTGEIGEDGTVTSGITGVLATAG